MAILLTSMPPTEGMDGQRQLRLYTAALHLFVRSLRATGNTSPLVALVSDETPEEWLASLREYGIWQRHVQVLTSVGTLVHYTRMVTKLHLWNMTEYDAVAYYDVDQIFMRNPAECFAQCGNAPFCAVQDPGMKRIYFNAGFLLLRPNTKEYRRLLSLKHLADDRVLAEQDMLNTVYAGNWKALPARCSYMPKDARKFARFLPALYRARLSNAVNIHEKFWQLRMGGFDKLPAMNHSYWPWNQLIERVVQ